MFQAGYGGAIHLLIHETRFAMTDALIDLVQQSHLRTDLPRIDVGDTVDVHVRIIEGAKERLQIFNGVVIKLKGRGVNRTMTVRRIVANEGVERIFPLNSTRIANIEVNRHGHVRRAKLYYLRERVGNKRRLRDRRRGLGQLAQKPPLPSKSQKDPMATQDDQANQPQAAELNSTESADKS